MIVDDMMVGDCLAILFQFVILSAAQVFTDVADNTLAVPPLSSALHPCPSASQVTSPSMSGTDVQSEIAAILASGAKPGLVVVDLDYTLWEGYVDCTYGKPYKIPDAARADRAVDRAGSRIELFAGARSTLHALHALDVPVGIASRSPMPDDARHLLNTFGIEKYVVTEACMQIYPGSKKEHFRHMARSSRVPHSDMLFFDDEERNIREVSALGVTCVLVNRDAGFCVEAFMEGIDKFRRAR